VIKPVQIFFRYIGYYFRATTIYRIHSPFVYEFIKATLEDKRTYYQFAELESIRRRLLRNKRTIEVTDFGAGSQVITTRHRAIGSMASSSLTPPAYSRLLFRMVNYLKPKTLLELGTSFGISSLYLYLPNKKAKMVTMEGCPNVAQIAQNSFDQMKADDLQLVNAPFDQSLPDVLTQFDQIDFLFVDGNHKREPTLFYFKQALKKATDKSCFVFHDIHWTEEMEGAWRTIQEHPRVRLTIDLFFMGLVFFNPDVKEKEHYTIIESKWKPWVRGFFK